MKHPDIVGDNIKCFFVFQVDSWCNNSAIFIS